MSDTREKIAKSMWEYDNPQDKNAIKIKFEDYPKSLDFIQEYYTKADAILSLVREAVSAVNQDLSDLGNDMYDKGYKAGSRDTKKSVMEVLS